jgi:predicted nuclease of restriction endonuclease-like (RecB) superfamily
MDTNDYKTLIIHLKSAILQSRFDAARLANKELLGLHFQIGKLIAHRVQQSEWGAKILDKISNDLQTELPGLRGFSTGNLKKMRVFYSEWSPYLQIGSSVTNQFESNSENEQKSSQTTDIQIITNGSVIGSSLTNQLQQAFFSISFTHHYTILTQTARLESRLFYIEQAAREFWTVRNLEKNMKADLFDQLGKLPNNFERTLPDAIGNKAVRMFKDEYLFDYINIEEEDDERIFETEIMHNIKKFIMSLGNDFSFIANQFRVLVQEDEFFIDLLFFNRKIQSLVAIELKRGKFKAEYAGKMNLYLSALDEYVKQPHENPSIGIVLCKEKNDKVVEFAFRDFNKAMGVATYKTSREIPSQFKGVLPNVEDFKNLLE